MDMQKSVKEIMKAFALRTGFVGKEHVPKRYLWTDAFAVCNFLGLYQKNRDEKYIELASKLVDQVHQVLGKFSKEDSRSGWISGLSDKEALKHPTIGGLRIGKALCEREENEPYDDKKEWDRDGQYFHYLTKWMHALSRMTQVTGDAKYNQWAIELAVTAHKNFTYYDKSSMQQKMYWKMSIDLKRPLVLSMGQHDALDAWVTYQELQKIAHNERLVFEIKEAKAMAEKMQMRSDDPLGIGGLLNAAFFLMQISQEKEIVFLEQMLRSAFEGLDLYLRGDSRLNYSPDYRLAFRELGLAIGLTSVPKMRSFMPDSTTIKALETYCPLGQKLLDFWAKPENQDNSTFKDHIDINSVMLATALHPEGYLHIGGETY